MALRCKFSFDQIGFILSLILLTSFFILFSFKPLETGDIWWHLKTGQWICENKQVPHVDPFSAYGDAHPWILTQWGGSVLLYSIYNWFGYLGLKIFRVSIFLSMVAMIYFFGRNRIPKIFLLSLLFTAAFAFTFRLWLRPLLFNFIFIPLFLFTLYSHHNSKDKKSLYVLPACGIVWGNLHMGSFMYGILLICIFMFADVIECFNLRLQKKSHTLEFKNAILKIKHLVAIFLLYLASHVFSPYGIVGLLHPVKAVLIPQYINFYNLLAATIIELQPPMRTLTSLSGIWFYVLLVCALLSLTLSKKDKMLKFLIFIFTLTIYLFGNRGSAFFALGAVFVILITAEELTFNTNWSNYKYSKFINTLAYSVLILVLLSSISHFANKKIYENGRFKRNIALIADPYQSLEAIKFLKSNGFHGLVLNLDAFGGQLLWEGYPQLRPFVDGRQVDRPMWFDYFKLMSQPEYYLPKGVEQYGIHIVLLDVSLNQCERVFNYLISNETWQLVFNKGPITAFVFKKAFNLSENTTTAFKQEKTFEISKRELDDILSDKPRKNNLFYNFLNPPIDYTDLMFEGFVDYSLGDKNKGIKNIYQGYKTTHSPITKTVLKKTLLDYYKN